MAISALSMQYFTYDLIAAANQWGDEPEEVRSAAEMRLAEAERQYHRSLSEVRPRLSKRAWEFFAGGSERSSLHDGSLMSLSVGDGLDYRTDGTHPFRVNRQTMTACLVFLNYGQDSVYTFRLRGVSAMRNELISCHASKSCIGDLYTCEITLTDSDQIRLGFLFASGATIVVDFRKLVF